MSQSSKTALGGMLTALSVVILIPSALEVFVYALAALAGMIIMFSVIELDKRWAFGIFAATSLLSVLVVPNKEAVIFYIAFFGYYPIVKALLESRVPRVVEYLLKFLVFNVGIVAATVFMVKVLGMPFERVMGIEGEQGFLREYIVPILLVLGNIVFVLYDIALTMVFTTYIRFWQKRFRKLFRFR